MADYKQIWDMGAIPPAISETILRVADQAYIPPDPANRDYQDYLAWVEAGGVPDPAPESA